MKLKNAKIILGLGVLLSGCDSAHIAEVRINSEVIASSVSINKLTAEENIKAAVYEFANLEDFKCQEPGTNQVLIECGPAWHRKIRLNKEAGIYKVVYLEAHPGWGKSQYFCKLQKRLNNYFVDKYGKENVSFTEDSNCHE